MSKKAAAFVLAFLASSANSAKAEPPPITVEKIGQEISSRLSTKDEQFTVKMKIIEADNSSKVREMKIQRLSPHSKEHYVLVRMQQPKDLRGTALLATLKNGKDERWLYLPSSKQTRRLASNTNESGAILGSELNVEDFNINTEQAAKNVLKKQSQLNNKKVYVVESDVNQVSTSYSKIVSSIASENFLPLKSECYDKEGKLLKQIDFADYKKVSGNKWRAGRIKIRNVQNQRGTELTLSDIKVNQNLKPTAFTPKVLSED